MRTLLSRIRSHFSDRAQSGRLDEEIAAHIDALAADYEARGMSPREALLAARREFGAVTQMREEHRGQRRLAFADALGQDLRYAWRQMAQNKLFTAAAILTLALGIGANTAVYEGLEYFIYRPMPVASPNQLAQIKLVAPSRPVSPNTIATTFSYPAYRDFAARQTVATGLYASAYFNLAKAQVRIAGSTQEARGVLVSGSFFPLLELRARAGRILTGADDTAAAPIAVVISDRFWERAFARSAGVVGASIDVNHAPATVVGVTPGAFKGEIFNWEPDFYLPLALAPRVTNASILTDPGTANLAVMARLKPGVSLAQAQTSIEALYRRLPGADKDYHVRVESGSRGIPFLQEQAELPGLLVMAVALLALLIACCNLANLLLSRAWSRTHEIGVRLAMGAGRARLLRQLFTESLALAVAGGGLSLFLYSWLMRYFSSLVETNLEAPMAAVIAATAVFCVLSTCVFGLVPAIAATRVEFHTALQSSRRAQSLAPTRNLLGQSLVVVQLSVSLLLISGSSLLLRSLWNVSHQDPGFRAEHVLIADFDLDLGDAFESHDAGIEQPLLARLRALPGVESAAIASAGPLTDNTWTSPLSSETHTAKQAGGQARLEAVSDRYFETLGVHILNGRSIDARDSAKTRKVIVLSLTAAHRLFGDANPVGRFVSQDEVFENKESLEVIGVAQDARYSDLKEPFGTVAYIPLTQQSDIPLATALLRTAGDPDALSSAVRKTIAEVMPNQKLSQIGSLSGRVDNNMDTDRTLSFLISAFSVVALGLACVGVFGVVAYGASSRTQEVGIRIALGAHRGEIARLLMGETTRLFAISAVFGIAGTLTAMQFVRSLLFGIAPWDPTPALAATATLALVAGLAAWLPAHRATRMHPMDALRQE